MGKSAAAERFSMDRCNSISMISRNPSSATAAENSRKMILITNIPVINLLFISPPIISRCCNSKLNTPLPGEPVTDPQRPQGSGGISELDGRFIRVDPVPISNDKIADADQNSRCDVNIRAAG